MLISLCLASLSHPPPQTGCALCLSLVPRPKLPSSPTPAPSYPLSAACRDLSCKSCSSPAGRCHMRGLAAVLARAQPECKSGFGGRSEDEEEQGCGWLGPGQVRDVERGWEEAEGGGSGRHRDGCWSPCYPKTPVRARGSQPSSHTNRLREQSYFSVPVFSSEKQIVALNSVNCYSSISCKMETERRKRKK